LLREAQRRKDSAYVSANLATAYAKAGFVADARDCLKGIPEDEQHEDIVQNAYRTITHQTESDAYMTKRLTGLMKLQKCLIDTEALAGLNETDEELLHKFIGEWQLDELTVVIISMEKGKLTGAICTENTYYEHAGYKVTARYEPGLLELDALLDEESLKERPEPKEGYARPTNPLGGLAGLGGGFYPATLLTKVMNRPENHLKLILAPDKTSTLCGWRTTSVSATSQSTEEPQMMLGAKEVHLIRRYG
jgi:hypothetical protein